MLAHQLDVKRVIKVYFFCLAKVSVMDIVPGVLAAESSSLQRLFRSRAELLLLACSCSRSVVVVEAASIFWSVPVLLYQCIPHMQFCIHLSQLYLISYHPQCIYAFFMARHGEIWKWETCQYRTLWILATRRERHGCPGKCFTWLRMNTGNLNRDTPDPFKRNQTKHRGVFKGLSLMPHHIESGGFLFPISAAISRFFIECFKVSLNCIFKCFP